LGDGVGRYPAELLAAPTKIYRLGILGISDVLHGEQFHSFYGLCPANFSLTRLD